LNLVLIVLSSLPTKAIVQIPLDHSSPSPLLAQYEISKILGSSSNWACDVRKICK